MIRGDKSEAEGVATTEGGRDFGVAADGVTFAGEVGAEGGDKVEDDAEISRNCALRGVKRIRQGRALHRQRGRRDANGERSGRRVDRGSRVRRGPKEPEQKRADRDEERER